MSSLNNYLREYQIQLSKGQIQKAYKGIMTLMSGLGAYLKKRYPDHYLSTLYFGYMDMTYFAFTPPDIKKKKLKIAIVYLHEQGRFDVWLGGSNRQIQAEAIEHLQDTNIIKPYHLSQVSPGVDSIIECILVEAPDFDHPEDLMKLIEMKTIDFIKTISPLISDFDN